MADLLQPLPYAAMQQLLDPLWGRGARNHMKAGYLGDLGTGAIDALLRGWEAKPSPMSELHVHHMGGAAARVARDSSAFPHRDAPFNLAIIARWPESGAQEPHSAWARGVSAAMEPYLSGGVYVNYLGDEGEQRIRDAYGPTFARLSALKQKYDPTNVFRLNQNIRPAA